MPFVITCPSCKARLKTMVLVPAGARANCPRCVTEFTLTEDSPELLEKKTPPLKSATNTKITGDQADSAGAGSPSKPKLKKNRGEDDSEGVQTRSQKEQVTDDPVKDKDVQKRRTRRDDADEMEERSPSARSKPRKKKKNPLFLVLAISIPVLILFTGGVGYGFYAYFRSEIEPSDDKLSASIPLKREVKAGSSVGTQLFLLETMHDDPEKSLYRIKYKNGKAPAEEIYLVSSSEDGQIVHAGLLDMRGSQAIEYYSDRILGKHAYVWIGRSVDGSLTNFIRISNYLHIYAKR